MSYFPTPPRKRLARFELSTNLAKITSTLPHYSSKSSFPSQFRQRSLKPRNKCGQYAPFGRRTVKPLHGLPRPLPQVMRLI